VEVALVLRRVAEALTCAALTVLATAVAAHAANFNAVASIPDAAPAACAPDTSCNLRSAITSANAADGNTVTVAPGTYNMHSGLGNLTVTKGIAITGAGANSTIVDGAGNGGNFLAIDGTPAQPIVVSAMTIQSFTSEIGGAMYISTASTAFGVNLSDVLLTGNSATGVGAGSGGGGIYLNAGTLNLTHSTISGNHADASGAQGGGINSFGALNVTASTISGNTAAQSGGGIFAGAAPVSTLTVTNGTIANNTATGGIGGGIDDETRVSSATQSTLSFDTIAGNTGEGYFRGALANSGPSIGGTLLANNTPSQCQLGAAGSPTSAAPNLATDTSCQLAGPADLQGPNPLLGPLANNGGPTATEALAALSPAIDSAGTTCPATDQRGVARAQGLACDIGAYEVAPPAATTDPATAIGLANATLNGHASNPDAVAATVSFQYGTSTAYGSQSAAQPLAAAGSTAFAAAVSGLTPGTSYHFRAVAANPDGARFGADQTLTTPPRVSAASCSLAIGTPKLRGGFRALAARKRNGAAPGLEATVSCNQDASVSLAGTISAALKAKVASAVKKHKPKLTTFTLGTVRSTVSAGQSKKLTLTVSKSTLRRLTRLAQRGAKLSATLTLSATNANGTSTAKATIPKLKIRKKKR
jgi:hypothetical protein